MIIQSNQNNASTTKVLLWGMSMVAAAATLVALLLVARIALGMHMVPDEIIKLYAQTQHFLSSCVVTVVLLGAAKTYCDRTKICQPDSLILPLALIGSLTVGALWELLNTALDQPGLQAIKFDLLANTLATGLTLTALEWIENRRLQNERTSNQTVSLLNFLWKKFRQPRQQQQSMAANAAGENQC